MTAVAEAMKALATHVGETMNELKQTIVANSPSASPKAKAKIKKAKAKSVGISASEPAAVAASPLPSSIPCLSSPMAFLSYMPFQQLLKAVVAKSIASAPPPPPPGPDVYDLAPQQEEGEEEEGHGPRWFKDDPEVHVNFLGNDLPRPASIGIGSFDVNTPKAASEHVADDYEGATYKYKDLKDLKLASLPKDSVGYRSWRNAVLTQFGSIDRTGTARILRWLQACLQREANTDTIVRLQGDSGQLPRLDAYLASQVTDTRYMKGELGLEIQAYIEQALAASSPLEGRCLPCCLERFVLTVFEV